MVRRRWSQLPRPSYQVAGPRNAIATSAVKHIKDMLKPIQCRDLFTVTRAAMHRNAIFSSALAPQGASDVIIGKVVAIYLSAASMAQLSYHREHP
eukprot:6586306-Pyramimonas_sp.AAC.1